jgi:acyl-CoA thioesterase
MNEERTLTPQEILDTLIARDRFSAWLGLQVDEIGEGFCRLHYIVNRDMVNGFERVHGGILFSASDSALAFACNSHGTIAVALDVSITFTRPAFPGEKLTVTAKNINLGKKIGLYEIRTENEQGVLVCLFKGTAYRTSRPVV